MKIQADMMLAAAADASDLLKALSSPNRLMIVCRLVEGEQTVGALAAALGARESLISQHLAVLRRERIVSARRDGQSMRYVIASPRARAVVETLARQFCPADIACETAPARAGVPSSDASLGEKT
jgi:DNA-binding transcriptional ArsR family regulator